MYDYIQNKSVHSSQVRIIFKTLFICITTYLTNVHCTQCTNKYQKINAEKPLCTSYNCPCACMCTSNVVLHSISSQVHTYKSY